MFESINSYISKCVPVAKEELEYFDDILEYKKVSKKTTLLHEGEVCNFEAYIIKGCIRRQMCIRDRYNIGGAIMQVEPAGIIVQHSAAMLEQLQD